MQKNSKKMTGETSPEMGGGGRWESGLILFMKGISLRGEY
jgi:hypothetical protein